MTTALFFLRSMVPYLIFLAILIAWPLLEAQTIAEKLAGSSATQGELNPELQNLLQQVNRDLKVQYSDLTRLYGQVQTLYNEQANPEEYQLLLAEINLLREQIAKTEESWRKRATAEFNTEPYALWHQPETTLGDIIIDYGSQSYVYLIPASIANIKLSLDSSLPIPRGAWDETLELILAQNGVGIRQLNPFLRELYLLKDDFSPVALITNKRSDLEPLPSHTRVCFVLSPDPAEVRRIWFFLDKFVNPKTTMLQNVGRDILIIAPVGAARELLKLYDFAISTHGERSYRLVPLKRAEGEEIARVIRALFDQLKEEVPLTSGDGKNSKSAPPPPKAESNGLQVIPLKNIAPALFLIGTPEEIKRAVQVIREVEGQIGGSKEKTIFTYQARHSSADDLAEILDKVYPLMVKTGAYFLRGGPRHGGPPWPGEESFQQVNRANPQGLPPPPPLPPPPIPADMVYGDSYYQRGNYVINPDPIEALSPAKPRSREPERNNFIVDDKTNQIIMVVEVDTLPSIKELLAKVDVPKRMVQIEVLLFEKRLTHNTNFGLNLLRIGSKASHTTDTGATFNDRTLDPLAGVFNFFLSRKKGDTVPAFDLIYSFLISQNDIQFNACPSILTLNQTPAVIAIQEEISVNTGIFLLDQASGQAAQKDSYTRAQYGIVLKVTPTIQTGDEDEYIMQGLGEGRYITMDTEVTFDNILNRNNDRPDVARRKITNLVRIPDGQSVILGGLRRKDSADEDEHIPFLGEIPGLGKLFSRHRLHVENTEMFIVLTPRIIDDPLNDLERMKWESMCRRPGDLPEFLCILQEARDWEKRRLMRGSMEILFGHDFNCSRCEYEYDGR